VTRPDPLDSARGSAPPGGHSGFEAVFRTSYPGLCDFVHAYVGSRAVAEELVQDLFLRLWQTHGEASALAKPYLYAAARNRALRHLRRRRLTERWETEAAGEGSSASHETAADAVHLRDAAAVAERAVQQLPERCRLVYRLRREQHLSTAEVAELLGVSVSTVETQMWRALKSLRAALAPYLGLAVALAGSVGEPWRWLR
jgi:RNA polymerase sigma-70 factor (ECF subfamily)